MAPDLNIGHFSNSNSDLGKRKHVFFSTNCICLFPISRSERLSPPSRSPDLHPLPDARVGKRVSLQPLLDETSQDRNSTRTMSHRETDQNLVPKQEDEAKEGTESRQGDQRAGTESLNQQ
jgi:hypothetical protein